MTFWHFISQTDINHRLLTRLHLLLQKIPVMYDSHGRLFHHHNTSRRFLLPRTAYFLRKLEFFVFVLHICHQLQFAKKYYAMFKMVITTPIQRIGEESIGGYVLSADGGGEGYPPSLPPPETNRPASICYAAGGMPLVFTQENFLVLEIIICQSPS